MVTIHFSVRYVKNMSEFVRQLKISDILTLQSKQEIRRNISARPDECGELAKRFSLEAVRALNAEVTIHPWEGSGVRVHGTINADVVQRCVISLKPIEQKVRESFVSFFKQPGAQQGGQQGGQQGALQGDINIDTPVDIEDPEDITPEGIDLGELVAQQLSLVLDPYPHIPGAALPDSAGTTTSRKSPFAVLQKQ